MAKRDLTEFESRMPQRIEGNTAFINEAAFAFFRVKPYSRPALSKQQCKTRIAVDSRLYRHLQSPDYVGQLYLRMRNRYWEDDFAELMENVDDSVRDFAEVNAECQLGVLREISRPSYEWILALQVPIKWEDLVESLPVKERIFTVPRWLLTKWLGYERQAEDFSPKEIAMVLDAVDELAGRASSYQLEPLKAHEVWDFYRSPYYRGWEKKRLPKRYEKHWPADNSAWIPNAEIIPHDGYIELTRNGESRFQATVVPVLLPVPKLRPPGIEPYHEVFVRLTNVLNFPFEATFHWRQMSKQEAKDYAKKHRQATADAIRHIESSTITRRRNQAKRGVQMEYDEHEKEFEKQEVYERKDKALTLSRYLQDRPTPMMESHMAFVVWGMTSEQVQNRVEELIDALEDIDIVAEAPTDDQRALFESWYPAPNWEGYGYRKNLIPETAAQLTTPGASDILGDPRGVFIGFTITGQPVFYHPQRGILRDRNSNLFISGDQGTGKTFILNLLVSYAVAYWSAKAIILDPKIERSLWEKNERQKGLPGLGHLVRCYVMDGTKHPGVLDPFRLLKDDPGRAKEQAIAIIDQMLQGTKENSFDRQMTLMTATSRLEHTDSATPTMQDLIKILKQTSKEVNPVAKRLGEYLEHCSQLPQGALLFGEGGEMDLPDSGIVVLQPEGLVLPEDREPSDMLEAASIAVMSTTSILMMKYLFDYPGLGVAAYDESWTLFKKRAGRVLFDMQTRYSRAKNVASMFASQKATDITDNLMELIGTYICLGTQTEDETKKAMEYLNIAENNSAVKEDLERIGSDRPEDGEQRLYSVGYMRDLEKRAGRVEFFCPNEELREFFRTRPEDVKKKKATVTT